MVLATGVSTNTGHGGNPKLHPSVLSGLKYCGFFSSRMLHYFPLSVRVCVGVYRHMPYESLEGQSIPIYKKTNSSSGYLCIPDQNRPDQSNSTPHQTTLSRDQLLQKTAFSLVKSRLALWDRLVVWLSPCQKYTGTHRKMVVDCPLLITSIFQTRPDQRWRIIGQSSLLHSWHWISFV